MRAHHHGMQELEAQHTAFMVDADLALTVREDIVLVMEVQV